MDDKQIVDLYWQRNEAAITQTQKKYGKYCFSIANNILCDKEDAEESVNDTYIGVWNAIPPHRPTVLSTFIGKITRRLSLKKLRERSAQKRGNGELFLSFDELEECIPNRQSIDTALEAKELTRIINAFLDKLPAAERRVFVCRYWYFDPISDISLRFGFSQSKVKMMLKRTRDKLSEQLRKEGIGI